MDSTAITTTFTVVGILSGIVTIAALLTALIYKYWP